MGVGVRVKSRCGRKGEKTKEKANFDFGAVVDGLRRQDSALDTDCFLVKLQVPAIQYLLRLLPNKVEVEKISQTRLLPLDTTTPYPQQEEKKDWGGLCDQHTQ